MREHNRGPQLSVAKPIQILWAMFFVLIIGVRGLASGSAIGVALGATTVVYLVATIACLFNHRMAWFVAIALPILPLMRWLPMICLNLFMFLTGHEPYQDSPGTIVVVAIYAVVFVAPAVLIYFCLFLDRKCLVVVLFPLSTMNRNNRNSNAGVNLTRATTDDNPYSPPKA